MSLLSGISITCFFGSYLVAWLLEVTRLVFRSGVRGMVMVGFAAAGFLAHTLYLVSRAVHAMAPPLSSNFDWFLAAAWLLVAAYLYLTYHYPRSAVGLFVLPLVLGLIAAGSMLADRQPFAPEQASRVWGIVHGTLLLLGTVTVMVGFVAGAMYLIQSMRLKRKASPTGGLRLPSLEWLEKVNSRVVVLSTLMIGLGFLAGIVLNIISRRRGAWVPWTDPVVWSSAAMLAWLLAAAVFNMLYRPARKGRKVAYLTVVSFLFLVLALGVLLLVNTQHPGQRAVSGHARLPGCVGCHAHACVGMLDAEKACNGGQATSCTRQTSDGSIPSPCPLPEGEGFGSRTLTRLGCVQATSIMRGGA